MCPGQGIRDPREGPAKGERRGEAWAGLWISELERQVSAGAQAVEGQRWGLGEEELGLRGGEGHSVRRGASGQLPRISCQKSNHKKAGGEHQGKEGEKGDGGEERAG